MPSIKELYKRLDDVRIDADSINLNTDGLESLLATTQADIALIKADIADGVAVRNTSTTGATPTTFTSTTYATISASNASRKGLTIFSEGAGLLYVTLGTSTTTASSYTARLSAGDYYEIPFEYTGLVGGLFATAGTARVTEVT
jgi:hypothetical protein